MKQLFYLLFGILISSITHAQNQLPTRYDTCTALEQLEGEWMYQNGQEQIKIYLRYKRLISYGNETGSTRDFVSDNLLGWVEYKVGNTIMETTYSNRYMTLNNNINLYPVGSFSIRMAYYLGNDTGCNSDSLWGIIRDYGHSNQLKTIKATLFNNNHSLNWKQEHQMGYGAFNGDYGMTLPANFVLIKQ